MTEMQNSQLAGAQAMFSQWRGPWQLHRIIHNAFDTTLSGLVTGTVCMQSSPTLWGDGLLHYRETAFFRPQTGASIDVQRGFVYRLNARHSTVTASVLAAQGKESCPHTLCFDAAGPVAAWRARGGYICGSDRYEVRYLFCLDADTRLSQVNVAYRVQGPYKRYRTDTLLTRVDADR